MATNLTDSEDTYSSFGLGNLAINRFELVSETMAFGLAPPPLKDEPGSKISRISWSICLCAIIRFEAFNNFPSIMSEGMCVSILLHIQKRHFHAHDDRAATTVRQNAFSLIKIYHT